MQEPHMIVAIVAIAVGALAPWLLLACVLVYKHMRMRANHRLALELATRGAPIPPALLDGGDPRTADLRRGLVLSLVGVGLCVFLYEVGAPWSLGLIPLFAGMGYLLTWKMTAPEEATLTRPAAQT
jgi:Domain of unknown function (DUF6249)